MSSTDNTCYHIYRRTQVTTLGPDNNRNVDKEEIEDVLVRACNNNYLGVETGMLRHSEKVHVNALIAYLSNLYATGNILQLYCL